MIVNLGSIEVDDRTCRAIRKATFGISGRATRNEVRAFALAAVAEELAMLDVIEADSGQSDSTEAEDDAEEDALAHVLRSSAAVEQQWLRDLFVTDEVSVNA